MITAAGGKPIAIGECDTLPKPGELAAQPLWTFFMGWSELVYSNNSDQDIRDVYDSANVVSDHPLGGPGHSG